jgi:hypothetical protein
MNLRPVLLLTEPIGPKREVLVAYISSVVPSLLLPSDILLDSGQTEAQATNLKVISVLRLHKLNQTARHWHSPVGAKHLREGCLLCGDAAGKCFAPTPRRVHCPNVLWSDLATIHATSVRRYLGKISTTIEDEVKVKLKVLLSL